MKLKLKHSIYLMIFLCSFIPVCIWILFSIRDSEQRMQNVVSNNIEAIGGSQKMAIENFCESRREGMTTIAKMALVQNTIKNYETEGHSEELDKFLADNELHKGYVASISVVDMNFNIIGSSENYPPYGISEMEGINEKYHTGKFTVGIVYERQTDDGLKRMVPFYQGIYDEDGLIGYLVVEVSCEYFDRLRLHTDFLEDGTLYLFDENDEIITAGTAEETESREEMVSTVQDRENYYEAWNNFDHEKNTEGVIYYQFKNQDYMTYFANIESTNWNLRITENMTAQWKSNQNTILLIVLEGLSLVAIMIIVQVIITKRLVAPVNKIVNVLKSIKEKHDYSLRINVKRKDEIGAMAQGIDELLEYIEEAEIEEKRRHREETEELQHKEFLSEAMLANMPSGYHRCKPDIEKGFPFMQLGSHIENILGWTAEEIKNDLGNCYRNLIWPEDIEVAEIYMDMVSKAGQGNTYDTSVYRMKHKDGGYRWITDATMFVDLGEESFFQGVIADITEYVEGLEEAKQMAEASSHAKTEFLSQMSHDIRTPMNAIIGFTNLAKKSESYEEVQTDFIPKIEIASNQLLMIINDVLEMNSIEKGKVVLHNKPFDMIGLLHSISEVMELQLNEKKLQLVTDIQVENPFVHCDENRFGRVFTNLMSNAMKFTPEGGTVTIFVEQLKSEKEGYGFYRFKLSDTGIGISEEFLPKIFEPFERERTSTISRVEGTGLGMAIVKGIIDAAGGTIRVESELGKGTTFIIEMYLELVEPKVVEELGLAAKKEEQQKEILSAENLESFFAGKRILLAEDNEFNRMIAETVLENIGIEVESVEDGHLAVEKMENAPSEDYYDAVLMDVQMPTMDGYEATKRIREMKDKRANVKIIAVTANAFESDKENAKKAGMDAHIAKPIDVDVLYKTLLTMTKK